MTALSLFEQPKARASDPMTAHEAAASVRPASRELIDAIVWWVGKQPQPVSAFQIADAIAGARWSHATVRTAVSRAGLWAVDADGVTPRRRKCLRYRVRAS